MNVNQHVIDNLNYYLYSHSPEYAFLISGAWGVGKTHFIDAFISEKGKQQDLKLLKVSLFGLKTIAAIDQQIFQQLHPILGSKYSRFAGNIIKGAISLGFKVDLDSDGKSDSSVSTKFDQFDVSEYFSDSDKKKEIVLIFDDLERAEVEIKEILGYINALVEASGLKVILLANEKCILDCEEKGKAYKNFKEKVIGKTFEITHNFDEVLRSFLEDSTHTKLLEHTEVIKEVYESSGFDNLRKIKQAIGDFDYLITHLKDEYIRNREFSKNLVRVFFALSLEIKKGTLDEDSLKLNKPFRSSGDKDCPYQRIYKKYFVNNSYVYNGEIWCDIFFKGDVSRVNAATAKLPLFIEKTEPERPVWLKLWHFRELEDAEFSVLIQELEQELEALVENSLSVYLQKLALAIYFSKHKLSKFSVEEIKQLVQQYITNYVASDLWKNVYVGEHPYLNGTGYGYIGEDDSDFNELKKLLADRNKQVYDAAQQEKVANETNAFIAKLKDGQVEEFAHILLNSYEREPILELVEPSYFIKSIIASKNQTLLNLRKIFEQRYTENKIMHGVGPFYFYLVKELGFWQNVEVGLRQYVESSEGLKAHLMYEFNKYSVSIIIQRLKSIENKN